VVAAWHNIAPGGHAAPALVNTLGGGWGERHGKPQNLGGWARKDLLVYLTTDRGPCADRRRRQLSDNLDRRSIWMHKIAHRILATSWNSPLLSHDLLPVQLRSKFGTPHAQEAPSSLDDAAYI
jgi:hypothetical protein